MSLVIERHYLLLKGNCYLNNFSVFNRILVLPWSFARGFNNKNLARGHGLTISGTGILHISLIDNALAIAFVSGLHNFERC